MKVKARTSRTRFTARELALQELRRPYLERERQLQREIERSRIEAEAIARARRKRIRHELLEWWAPYLFPVALLIALLWCAGP